MKWLPTAALLVCLTAGCQTDTGGPPVPPTPTGGGTSAPTSASSVPTPEPTCTPDGARYPEARSCSEEERAEQIRLDELEAEAMQVYQEVWDERLRLLSEGNTSASLDYIEERTSGAYWLAMQRFVGEIQDEGGVVTGESTVVVRPARGVTFGDSEVVLSVCEDARKAVTRYDDGSEYPGVLVYWTIAAKHDPSDGRLKLHDGETREVDECPIS